MAFLLVAPPVMANYAPLPRDGADHAPPPRSRAEVAAVLAGAPDPPAQTRPLKLTLVAGKKDHGPGEHDYPQWQRVWSRLFTLARDTEVTTAWEWPSPRQWESSDVLVFYKKGNWTRERSRQLATFLEAGGGAVFIHWACEGGEEAPTLAEVIGLASDSRQTKYRHGLLELTFDHEHRHPITRGFEQTRLHDESYWNLVGDPERFRTLATAPEAGHDRPLLWVLERGKGRVFVSIPGHYSWSFDDSLFRTLLLRGLAWSAREPVDRFNNLIEAGVDAR